MLWQGVQRHLLGKWWSSSSPDYVKRTVMLSITGSYPSPAMLQRWGRLPPGPCSLCPRGNLHACTQCHLQTSCGGTKSARIAAHHALRSLLSTLVVNTAKGWVSHPELTLGATRSLLAENGVHIPELPPFSHLAPGSTTSTMVDWSQSSHWRPDDTLLHLRSRTLVIAEFTRAWDGTADYDDKQDALKGRRYSAWLAHLRLHLPHGWSAEQLNFTIGSRGSILQRRWDRHLDTLRVPLTARDRVYTLLHHQALSSLYDVFQAAKAARLKQATA